MYQVHFFQKMLFAFNIVLKYLKFLFQIIYIPQISEAAIKDVLEKCSKVTGEHPRGSGISIKLLSNATVIEIAFRRGCFSANLLHIFRTPFSKGKNTLRNFSFRVFHQALISQCIFILNSN